MLELVCGINGIVSFGEIGGDCRAAVARMNAALAHRGPDDEGIFSDDHAVLGQRRLSIIDLSSAGHQPMQSPDNRFVLVFNGEIYNFRELRKQMDYPFQSNSDSEVLLAAWLTWGPDCVDRLVGMFAFAVWDKLGGELYLVRDRLGIKPLYYHVDDECVVFSSEVRAVLASHLVPGKVNPDSLVDYLRYQCVHQPHTIVDGVHLLPPATWLRFRGRDKSERRYWSPVPAGEARAVADIETARKDIYNALLKAVERRLVADVPFGAFLSGGIDSSVIVALMSQITDRVSTFSISFAEEAFSEARYARRVARKFNTDHHEIQLSPDDFLDLLPEALDHMDHPSGDGPNTYVVSRATKNAGITMALSGLGGDELFAGYPIFRQSARLQRIAVINAVPRVLRKAAGQVLHALKPSVATAKMAGILAKERVSMLAAYPFYRQVLLDNQVRDLVSVNRLPPNRVEEMLDELGSQPAFRGLPLLGQVSVAEMATYMQNVLLRDTDQMSMAHALEVRVPFLDHELVELVMGLPDKFKSVSSAIPKQLLVDSLGDLLPPEIVNRPKMGFSLPYAQWMKSELREFCGERIQRLAGRELFNGAAVAGCWKDFLDGKQTMTWSRVWTLVVLEHWLERNGVA